MLFYSLLTVLDDYERNCAEEIFENYYKLIYEVAYKILNNRPDAEDTVDEVMISVMKNIERFMYVERNDIESQLVIYSRNAAINTYNKNKRRSKHLQSFTFMNEDNNLDEIDIADESDSVEDIVISKETSDIVRQHVQKLSQEYQDVIELVYGMGYTNVEAAYVLHITPNAVGMKLFRAKKKLLSLVGGELHERIK